MVWFKRTYEGWDKYLLDAGTEFIEAGGDFADIDGDGDFDIVQGGDWRTLKEVWWWENPAPDFDPEKPWNRYLVKNSDEANRSLNRRVDILLSAQFASGTAPAKKPAPRFPL